MNEDEVSIVSLFSFFESDNKISLESLGVPEEPVIPTVLEEPAIPTTFAVSLTDIQLDPFTDCLTDIFSRLWFIVPISPLSIVICLNK
jgi:hypothetical protein